MATNFLKHAVTDSVRKAQEHYYGSSPRIASTPGRDALTVDEIAFVRARDSFYMATVSESGRVQNSLDFRRRKVHFHCKFSTGDPTYICSTRTQFWGSES